MSSEPAAVIGLAPFVDVVHATWVAAEPHRMIARLVVRQGSDYAIALDCLDDLATDVAEVALGIDHRFLGFKRLELLAIARGAGRDVVRVIGRTAAIAGSAELGAAIFVGEGAVIGAGSRIGAGACVGARAVVGAGAVIERGAWLAAGAIIGDHATIGAQTSVASGVIIDDGAAIGELCVLGKPGVVRGVLAARTFLHPWYPEPIRVLGG